MSVISSISRIGSGSHIRLAVAVEVPDSDGRKTGCFEVRHAVLKSSIAVAQKDREVTRTRGNAGIEAPISHGQIHISVIIKVCRRHRAWRHSTLNSANVVIDTLTKRAIAPAQKNGHTALKQLSADVPTVVGNR